MSSLIDEKPDGITAWRLFGVSYRRVGIVTAMRAGRLSYRRVGRIWILSWRSR